MGFSQTWPEEKNILKYLQKKEPTTVHQLHDLIINPSKKNWARQDSNLESPDS